MRYIKAHLGFTLLELLVTMAISSMLMLGITQVFIDSRKNFDAQNGELSNLDNSRFSDITFSKYIQKAGFRLNPAEDLEIAFPNVNAGQVINNCMQFAAGSAATLYRDTTSSSVGFCIRYLPAYDDEADCIGRKRSLKDQSSGVYNPNLPAADAFATAANRQEQIITTAFYFKPSPSSLTGDLLCESVQPFTSNASPNSANVQDIVTDIVDFRVTLIDRTGNEIQQASVATSAPVAIEYSMLLASEPNTRVGRSVVRDSWIKENPSSKQRIEKADRGHIYQVVSGIKSLKAFAP